MTDLNELQCDLTYLKLHKTYELLLDKVNTGKISDETICFVKEMCENEKQQKAIRAANAVVRVANFPHLKTVDDFEFEF